MYSINTPDTPHRRRREESPTQQEESPVSRLYLGSNPTDTPELGVEVPDTSQNAPCTPDLDAPPMYVEGGRTPSEEPPEHEGYSEGEDTRQSYSVETTTGTQTMNHWSHQYEQQAIQQEQDVLQAGWRDAVDSDLLGPAGNEEFNRTNGLINLGCSGAGGGDTSDVAMEEPGPCEICNGEWCSLTDPCRAAQTSQHVLSIIGQAVTAAPGTPAWTAQVLANVNQTASAATVEWTNVSHFEQVTRAQAQNESFEATFEEACNEGRDSIRDPPSSSSASASATCEEERDRRYRAAVRRVVIERDDATRLRNEQDAHVEAAQTRNAEMADALDSIRQANCEAQKVEGRRQWRLRFLAQNWQADQEHRFDPEVYLEPHEVMEINNALNHEDPWYLEQVARTLAQEEDQPQPASPGQNQSITTRSPTRPRKKRRSESPRRNSMRPRRRRTASSRRRRRTRFRSAANEANEQTPTSSKQESTKGTSLHDEGVNVKLVSDWEVLETPLETRPTRFDKDKYYLIKNKTVDSSEEVRKLEPVPSWCS
jgi:hypothetical protein